MTGLPAGVGLGTVLAVLVPVAVVTVLLRAIPFRARRALGDSDLVKLLGVTMPVGVMTVLVVYTLAGSGEVPGGLVAGLLGVGVTLVAHLLFRRPAVSILTGTLAYMALVNFVF
ncbi:branched-chain amino acid transport protein [Corynebacterium maris DSM 45190]|uniref:Branched-chain amino acid transport protein n=1 Tax=Corynebacterium maris DSM 45190 TaxID=1224163 RepID=S5T5Y0_9CORY|nr:AzlD domain-containing protein [Corynebacterium maris]AGS36010.1 branched-chain amino acid transport protein [Corynebacterium maris DSM 45190]